MCINPLGTELEKRGQIWKFVQSNHRTWIALVKNKDFFRRKIILTMNENASTCVNSIEIIK
jgi:hypothetical protein